ncbi:FadD32-like long-chain-fatty-acid--AMP ligase [Corynebacterium uterequi]|nr:FadD32-like long-chain-fatty-acid--AMP ligase [Corynebacterium uterequi]
MNAHAALGRFFAPDGSVHIPPQLTLAGLAEALYQADIADGGGDRKVLRVWDYSGSRDGEARDLTRTEVNTHIKAVGARLQQVAAPGERVAILAGNSAEYIIGFIGALYGGCVPVPLYDPREPGHGEHLRAVLADSAARIILTTRASAAAVRAYVAGEPAPLRPRIIAVDAVPTSLAASYTPAAPAASATGTAAPVDQIAFLQYTSGSTRTPAGVVLTNRSILTNVLQIFAAARLEMPLRIVSWLPLHHDMGIILAVFVQLLGLHLEMMSPRDFIQQPKRWVDQIARRGEDDIATYSVIPNFALDLVARYGAPEPGQDFSNIRKIIVGSEPVTKAAVERFAGIFEAHGLRRSVLHPSYGLAEASLLVTMPQDGTCPLFSSFDREALADGRAVAVDPENPAAVTFASNGQVVRPQELTIVDPDTAEELPDGRVGEIWLRGDNAAAGYLDRPEDTAATFGRTLTRRLADGSRSLSSGTGPNSLSSGTGRMASTGWVATGDLGVILSDQLYITGRLKDLVVVAGRNHYPQDIEATVEEASAHVRPASVAAFAVPAASVEKLVILAERADAADPAGDAEAIDAIRAAVARVHGVTPADIRLSDPMTIARSSSGKIARRVNQKAYLEQQA